MSEVRDNQVDRGGEMSTPDARLNAAERAALADLEAAAVAADPGLAARLRGGIGWRAGPALRSAHRRLARAWGVLLHAGWWGVPLAVAGFLLMVLGLGTTLALSATGAVMAAVGLRIVADMVSGRLARVAARLDRSGGPSAS